MLRKHYDWHNKKTALGYLLVTTSKDDLYNLVVNNFVSIDVLKVFV